MDLDHIKALIETMAASDLAEMEVSENGWSLRLSRHATARDPAPTAAPPRARVVPQAEIAASADLHAPLSGVLHLQPAPGAAPFVQAGAVVRAGDILCLIEAMKVFNTVRAEHDGMIAAVLVETSSEVEAGQLLMRIA